MKRKHVKYTKKKAARPADKNVQKERSLDHKITKYLKGIKVIYDKFDINKWNPKQAEAYLHVEL